MVGDGLQAPLSEYNFDVRNVVEDLQDGIRLCRLAQLMSHDLTILGVSFIGDRFRFSFDDLIPLVSLLCWLFFKIEVRLLLHVCCAFPSVFQWHHSGQSMPAV